MRPALSNRQSAACFVHARPWLRPRILTNTRCKTILSAQTGAGTSQTSLHFVLDQLRRAQGIGKLDPNAEVSSRVLFGKRFGAAYGAAAPEPLACLTISTPLRQLPAPPGHRHRSTHKNAPPQLTHTNHVLAHPSLRQFPARLCAPPPVFIHKPTQRPLTNPTQPNPRNPHGTRQAVVSGRGKHLGIAVTWSLRWTAGGAFREEIRGPQLTFAWGHDGAADSSCWEVRGVAWRGVCGGCKCHGGPA